MDTIQTCKHNQRLTNITGAMTQGHTADERARLISIFIELASALLDLGNFTGVNAVVSGLRLNPTLQLKGSWEKVPSNTMEKLQNVRKVMSEERSYAAYRSALEAIPSEQACVPHLGVHLFVLTFMEDGNKDMLPDRPELINFQKWRLICSAISELVERQTCKYDIPYVRHS